jgi:hypothetical protein
MNKTVLLHLNHNDDWRFGLSLPAFDFQVIVSETGGPA